MTIRLRYKFFTLLSILTLASMPMGRDHAAAVVTPPATKCNIRIDDPHISKYLLRTRGVLAVKVNARSTCDKAMRNLVLKVEIYKVGLFRDYQVDSAEIRIPGLIYANKVIKNEEAMQNVSPKNLVSSMESPLRVQS